MSTSSKVILSKINETYMKVIASEDVHHELYDAFSFFVPNAKFHPKVKAKLWDGQIHMLNLRTKQMYVGLLSNVVQYLKENNYEVEINFEYKDTNVTPELVMEYIKSLNIHSDNESIKFRNYQYYAVFLALKYFRRTILSATGSGKSAILYALVRYLLENTNGKILITVIDTGLAHQLFSDFKDYSSHNGFDVEANCHLIMEGKEKHSDKRAYISTWQSIYKLEESYFDQFESIIGDEFHHAKADCLKSVYEKSTKARYRIGFTGTLDGIPTNELVVKGITGEITRVSSTHELMDRGELAKLKIKNFVLQYPEDVRSSFKELIKVKKGKSAKKLNGQEVFLMEMDYLMSNQARNEFIIDLAIAEAKQGKNVLILFRFIDKHGKLLYEELLKRNIQNVHYIHGRNSKAEERNELRAIINNSFGNIILSSEKLLSTGINIKNLHSLIFGMSSKTITGILQRIGRVLRLTKDKDESTLFDIGDDISTGKTKNYSLLHNIERLKIYNSEKFDYEIINKDI